MIVETKTPAFSERIDERGELLMHHQCWFFGRDIMCPDGNLLIQYGFERLGVEDPKAGSNRYRLVMNDLIEVDLWGFGMFYGRSGVGGIFIKRFDFRPCFFRQGRLGSRIFKTEHLPRHHSPGNNSEAGISKTLTIDAINWLVEYEKWIEQTCGKGWRRQCLSEWPHSSFPARKIRSNWSSLKRQIERLKL